MLIKIKAQSTAESIEKLQAYLNQKGGNTNSISTQYGSYMIYLTKKDIDIRSVGAFEAVEDVFIVSDPYKLVSRKWKKDATVVDVDGVKIGDGSFAIMAGPCSIESEEQIQSTIAHLVANNIRIMRGGVYKPRSSPYSFRGLGLEGLQLFYKHCRAAGIKIVTEVMQVSQIEPMHDFIDIYQVGARNSQNFNLLDELGKVDKPILLKRSMSGTIDELLQSAEYIFSNGNERIMLCERGIRTYEKAYRNCMDINAISILKEKSHLPVIADPSHGIGIRKHVENVGLASIMAGADGIITEVHQNPQKAFSDGQQTLTYNQANRFYNNIRMTHELKSKMEVIV